MNYRTILLVIVSVIALIAITFIMYKQSVNNAGRSLAEQTTEKQEEPERTDFGTIKPNDFPADIPIEEGVEFEQSYGLNYTNQEQLTIVFASTETVK